MHTDRSTSPWRSSEFSIPGITVSLVVGIGAALVLRLVGVAPLWLTLIAAPAVIFVLSWAAVVAAGMLGGPKPIFHLAITEESNQARRGGEPYRRSTLGVSLDDHGFIHCSFPHRAPNVAELSSTAATETSCC